MTRLARAILIRGEVAMAEVPTIDIAGLFANDRAAQAATDARIGEAVFEAGGFVISGYPGADGIDARAIRILSFFDLPDEVKRTVASRVTNPENPRVYRGYLATLEQDGWAHNEFFDIGPEEPVPGPSIPGMEILSETNAWPEIEPTPGWRQAMSAYYGHMNVVAAAVMMSAGRSVGVAEEDLEMRFSGGNSTLRLLNYPIPPKGLRIAEEAPDERAPDGDGMPLATGRHTDKAGVSLLWQGGPGLQAQAPDGRWRDVPCYPNSISVHLGDVLEIMTEGRVPATPHRVIDHRKSRRSIGFFLEPALNARISPIHATDRTDGADPSARGTYGWHLLRQLRGYEGYEHLVPPVD
jgi:isopenicillin N synthase-like dioxygenase